MVCIESISGHYSRRSNENAQQKGRQKKQINARSTMLLKHKRIAYLFEAPLDDWY